MPVSASRSLTARGRFFLIGGASIIVLGALWGERALAWIGVLLVALPVAAMIVLHRTQVRLTSERTITPPRASIGDLLTAGLHLAKSGALPVGLLQFEDAVPSQLGRPPRFAVHRFAGQWERRITYPLMGLARGRFRVGPLTVHAADPFGMAQLDSTFPDTDEVMITPQVFPLQPLTTSGGAGATGEATPQRLGRLGQDDVLVREYRQGDDVRRVHWRSTARWGELMVRREEQAWEPSVTVLLDNRATHHTGTGRTSSFEWAVSAAASACSHFTGAGYRIGLIDAAGGVVTGGGEDPRAAREAMLIALTDSALCRAESLAAAADASIASREGEIVVAVLGRLNPDDVVSLERIRRMRSQGVALVLHPRTFAASGGGPDAAQLDAVRQLREQRWRVVEVNAGTAVPDAWELLGREALV